MADSDQVQAAVDAALGLGPLRALVNAAGLGNANRTVNREGKPFPLDQFEFVIRVNLIGTFNCLRLAAAAMSQQEPVDADGQRGAIVNIASVAAFDGQIGQAAYSASKGGVVGLTLPVARDLSAIGIRVNTIAPGLIDTPIYGQGEGSEQFKANLGRNVLFPKRLGRRQRAGVDGRRVHHQRLHERRDACGSMAASACPPSDRPRPGVRAWPMRSSRRHTGASGSSP